MKLASLHLLSAWGGGRVLLIFANQVQDIHFLDVCRASFAYTSQYESSLFTTASQTQNEKGKMHIWNYTNKNSTRVSDSSDNWLTFFQGVETCDGETQTGAYQPKFGDIESFNAGEHTQWGTRGNTIACCSWFTMACRCRRRGFFSRALPWPEYAR